MSTPGAAQAWIAFLAMAVGMFFAILDIQIVASSLLDLREALDIPKDRLSWVQTSYLVAEIITIALTGYLTRLCSTRWLFVIAITGFTAASVACALSPDATSFLVARFVQGLFGGAVIPLVFAAAFVLFPKERQALATAIGGGLAMLAPTVGPFIGGWLTSHFSWHWIFLINVAPCLAVAAIAAVTVRIDEPDWALWRRLDVLGLALVALALGSLELTLREVPAFGWTSLPALGLIGLFAITAWATLRRLRRRSDPLIDLSAFSDRTFAIGCGYSFVLGMGLFGSVYLMPLYLGFVHSYGPLQIGTVMVVMGAAQLATAPFAAFFEPRIGCRVMTAMGFSLFALGLAWNGLATPAWLYDELFWPQVTRGAAVMLCLVPTATLALGQLSQAALPNASALFNLMRNLGGAVGLAMIDTVARLRTPVLETQLQTQIADGSQSALAFTGAPEALAALNPALIMPWIERAAVVKAYNEAWLILGGLAALSLLFLPLCRPPQDPAATPEPGSQS